MLLLICYLCQLSMQDCVQDANGFSDLPSGLAIVSDPNYSAGGLLTYYDLVVGFIDTVQPLGYQGWGVFVCVCAFARLCMYVYMCV